MRARVPLPVEVLRLLRVLKVVVERVELESALCQCIVRGGITRVPDLHEQLRARRGESHREQESPIEFGIALGIVMDIRLLMRPSSGLRSKE